MSAVLLTAVIDRLRASFTRADLAEVRAYGGEFNSAEFDATSYTCPAVLITVLGWKPEAHSKRLSGRDVRSVRLAAFVVAKHAKREARLTVAMTLAERVAMVLRQWHPADLDVPVLLGPLEAEPTCENLYSRAIDAKGQALWLVSWEQCCKPLVPLSQLYDLLSVDITDTTRQGTAPAAAGGTTNSPTVTEQVDFATLPPSA